MSLFFHSGGAARAFSSCSKRGYSLVAVHGLAVLVSSLVCRAQALAAQALVAAACGLCSCDGGLHRPTARATFPEQGSNSCPLHWQVDSWPLDYQRSPVCYYLLMHTFPLPICSIFFFFCFSNFLTHTSNLPTSLLAKLRTSFKVHTNYSLVFQYHNG